MVADPDRRVAWPHVVAAVPVILAAWRAERVGGYDGVLLLQRFKPEGAAARHEGKKPMDCQSLSMMIVSDLLSFLAMLCMR